MQVVARASTQFKDEPRLGHAHSIDLQFDCMMAGMVSAGGEVAQGLLFA